MKIYHIVEQADPSEQLAKSFSETQWRRIINYFFSLRGESLGGNNTEISERLKEINDVVGLNMRGKTPESWNTNAARYGMSLARTPTSWEEIYNHLAPHATYREPANWTIAGPRTDVFTDISGPRERRVETSGWVQTNVTSWSDPAALRTQYIRPWVEHLSGLQPDFMRWVRSTESSGRNNIAWDSLISVRDNLFSRITTNGSVDKDRVDIELYNWYRNAWDLYGRRRQPSRN